MVKVISLSDEAYRRLKAIKGNRSFSEIVIDITSDGKKKDIMKFCGLWRDDSKYWENFKKEIRKSRDRAKLREVKF